MNGVAHLRLGYRIEDGFVPCGVTVNNSDLWLVTSCDWLSSACATYERLQTRLACCILSLCLCSWAGRPSQTRNWLFCVERIWKDGPMDLFRERITEKIRKDQKSDVFQPSLKLSRRLYCCWAFSSDFLQAKSWESLFKSLFKYWTHALRAKRHRVTRGGVGAVLLYQAFVNPESALIWHCSIEHMLEYVLCCQLAYSSHCGFAR